MNKAEIIKLYENKIKILAKHNESYYDKNSPKIPDSDYDILKKEVIELEKKYKFLKN